MQFDMIVDLSHIVEDSTARLDKMSHQEIAETFLRMGAITRRFLTVMNYCGNPTLPLFPRNPQSSSSRPPYQTAFYTARPRHILP
jgi:hypothetical protein